MPLVFSPITAAIARSPAASEGDDGGGDDVVMRIRKALDLALHEATPEAEANAAMRGARRLMTKYNLDQAQVMLETSAAADGSQAAAARGNMFHTTVRTARNKRPTFWRWMIDVSGIISRAYACKSCSNASMVRISFYGVEEAAEAAMHTFIKYADYMSRKMAAYKPPDYEATPASQRAAMLRRHRIAYCNGMVAGLRAAFAAEQRADERRQGRLREYLDVYDKLQRAGDRGDEFYEDMLDALARELNIPRAAQRSDAQLQVTVYAAALQRGVDVAESVLQQLDKKLGKYKKRKITGQWSTAYGDGVREGKRIKAAVTASEAPRSLTAGT
jgi:hypothetical protein